MGRFVGIAREIIDGDGREINLDGLARIKVGLKRPVVEEPGAAAVGNRRGNVHPIGRARQQTRVRKRWRDSSPDNVLQGRAGNGRRTGIETIGDTSLRVWIRVAAQISISIVLYEQGVSKTKKDRRRPNVVARPDKLPESVGAGIATRGIGVLGEQLNFIRVKSREMDFMRYLGAQKRRRA